MTREATFPNATLKTSRKELEPTKLEVLDGALPSGIRGHVFWPVALAAQDDGASPFVNADAGYYRLTFSNDDAVITAAVGDEPTMLAEEGVKAEPEKYPGSWRFTNFGISRMSGELGARNYPHTALLPVVVDGRPTLIASYDAGRPYMLDPTGLKFEGPVGENDEWRGTFLLDTPFKTVFASAHPVFDAKREELFITNFSIDFMKLVCDMIPFCPRSVPSLPAFDAMQADIGHLKRWIKDAEVAMGGIRHQATHMQGLKPEDWRAQDVEKLCQLLPNELADAVELDAEGMQPVRELLAPHRSVDAIGEDDIRAAASSGALALAAQTAGELVGFVDWVIRMVRTLFEFRKEGHIPFEKSSEPFTYLMRWTGPGKPMARFHLKTKDGKPVVIGSSAHQLGLTENHVVILDAAFKFEADMLLSIPKGWNNKLTRSIRSFLSKPQPSTTKLYLVPRSALTEAPVKRPKPPPPRTAWYARYAWLRALLKWLGCFGKVEDYFPSEPVKVIDVEEIARETVHFLVDHKERTGPDGAPTVRLHIVHQAAMDGGEFVLEGDQRVDGRPTPAHTWGMFPCSADVNVLARYDVDTTTGKVVASETKKVSSIDHTWTAAFSTAPGIASGEPGPSALEEIWFYNQGLLPELVTDRVFDLYTEYPHRQVPLDDVKKLLAKGKPPSLFRLETETMTIVDSFQLQPGQLILSPQHVPGTKDAAYLVCPVFSDPDVLAPGDPPHAERQVWIFDARDLGRGPICRMTHAELDFPHTVHPAWMPHLPEGPGPKPDWLADFGSALTARQRPFFEKVFGHGEAARAAKSRV